MGKQTEKDRLCPHCGSQVFTTAQGLKDHAAVCRPAQDKLRGK